MGVWNGGREGNCVTRETEPGTRTTRSAPWRPSARRVVSALSAVAVMILVLALRNGRTTGSWTAGRASTSLHKTGGRGRRPQCYSTPTADPSEGAWRKSEGGVQDSPAFTGNLDGTWTRVVFQRCRDRWAKDHRGEGPQPYWEWEPSNCRLDEVDVAKFCRVMKGRKGLLLVGDSLTQYMSVTLAAVLRAEVIESETKPFSNYFSACGGELRYAAVRNDFLDTRTTHFDGVRCEQPDISDSHCTVFAKDSILAEFDTLVVNSGAHRMGGGLEAFRTRMNKASEELTASMKRLHGDDAILVVRNTTPGHWGCGRRVFKGPVDRDVAAAIIARGPAEYEWSKIAEKNRILEDAFSPDLGWRVLDAYSPTYVRADAHRGDGDCLHYCIVGPIDHWVNLLYNILLAERAKVGQ